MAKHTYYFKHDFNAHNDEKILDLRMSHGLEGYGIFWYLIELLASAEDYTLENNYKRLAFSIGTNEKILKSVVEDFALFNVEDDNFYSQSLADRMNKLDEIKAKRAEFGRLGGKAKAKAKQKPSKTEANAKQILAEESKGEERIEEERTLNKSKGLYVQESFPTRLEEFRESVLSYRTTYSDDMLKSFFEYWTEKNTNGYKMRFEKEKTFDLSKRLIRWDNNNYSKKNTGATYDLTEL